MQLAIHLLAAVAMPFADVAAVNEDMTLRRGDRAKAGDWRRQVGGRLGMGKAHNEDENESHT
jgi:hypothetical protein